MNRWRYEEVAEARQRVADILELGRSTAHEKPQAERQQLELPMGREEQPSPPKISIEDKPIELEATEKPGDIPENNAHPHDSVESVWSMAPEAADAWLNESTPTKLYSGSNEVVIYKADDELPAPAGTNVVFAEEITQGSTGLAETESLLDPEIITASEVTSTFEWLLEFVGTEEKASWSAVEQYEPLLEEQVISFNQETVEHTGTNAFEAFVAAQPTPEVELEIKTIIAAAHEQSLEKTFVQLALCLGEGLQSSDEPAITSTLKDVIGLLPYTGANYAAEEAKLTITLELTQKLLLLLQAVGYPEPREVLIAFVADHDLVLLVQALRYLYQLCSEDNRQEFLPYRLAATFPSNSNQPFAARLSRAIGCLITARLGAPGVAASN
ncbi:MAG TPA: hypothetical protein VK712_00190 [Verrucomicrobiae bacterium]|jgi:hypothetical protein|nr:hypothetical protein [Verrucomicrobiae bacterium]